MSSSFIQTSRALDRDNFHAAKVLAALAILVLTGWIAWFFNGSMTLQETAPARVEFIADPFPIIVPRDGKVTAHKLTLNRQVNQDEVLLELDDFQAQMQRDGVQAQRNRIEQEHAQLLQEHDAAKRLMEQAKRRAGLELEEARLELEQKQTRLKFLEDKLSRTQKLYQEGKVAELDFITQKTERDETQQQVELLQFSIDRLKAQAEERAQELNANQLRLQSAIATNRGNLTEVEKRLQELDHERQQYQVRAPRPGMIAEVTPLAIGTQVTAGQTLGQLLETEKHVVRAAFTPAAAIGKLHPGVAARMRLDGFPWLQYGEIDLRVTSVANESRNGRIRVDFEVVSTPNAIELRHGLPGQVLVETEQISPMSLLLRSVGGIVPTGATSQP